VIHTECDRLDLKTFPRAPWNPFRWYYGTDHVAGYRYDGR
jgi:hypothetical protein